MDHSRNSKDTHDIGAAFALSQRTFASSSAEPPPDKPPGGGSIRRWLARLWRRRDGASPAYVVAHYQAELARAQESIAALEQRLASTGPARMADLERRAAAAEARLRVAEEEARQANNKVELLKDALELARGSRPTLAGAAASGETDAKFREAKRAFARQFHPDRHADPERARLFSEFWPVLERIDRG